LSENATENGFHDRFPITHVVVDNGGISVDSGGQLS
jgi:hypothetical protein